MSESKKRQRATRPTTSSGEENLLHGNYIWNTQSIKCSFGGFCKIESMRDALREQNHWFSQLDVHVHNVMTIYISENEGQMIPGGVINPKTGEEEKFTKGLLEKVWDTAYSTALTCLRKKDIRKTKDEQSRALKESLYDVCERYYADSGVARDWSNTVLANFSAVNQSQRRISATNHHSHLAKYDVYLSRFIHYCLQSQDSFLGEHLYLFEGLTRKQYNFVFGRIMALLREEKESINATTNNKKEKKSSNATNNNKKEKESIHRMLEGTSQHSREGIPEKVWDILEYFMSDFLLPGYYNKKIVDFDCQERSVKLYQMLQVLAPYGQEMQRLALESRERRRQRETISAEDVGILFAMPKFRNLGGDTDWKGTDGNRFRALYDNKQIEDLYAEMRKKKEKHGNRLSRVEKIAYNFINRFVRRRNATSRKTTRMRRQHKWAFDLCPQASYRPKYMPISNTGLQMLLPSFAKRDEKVKESIRRVQKLQEEDVVFLTKEGIDTKSSLAKHLRDFRYWDEFFNLKTVMKDKYPEDPRSFLLMCYQHPDQIPNAKRFGNSIFTDGYGTTALLEKLKEGIDKDLCKLGKRIATLKDKKGRTEKESEDLKSLEEQRKQMSLDQKKQQYNIPQKSGFTVMHILRQEDMDTLESRLDGWIKESRDISAECHDMVVTMQREFMTVFEQVRQGDPDQSRGRETMDFNAQLLHDLAKKWIERDMSVEWKERDMSGETRSQFRKMGKELMSLIEKVQIYETNLKVIGIDMGKSNIATAVYHDTSLQRVHMSNVKTNKEDRFKTLGITNKAWRHKSGQMAYTFLMKKRIRKFVPKLDSRPTTKTTNTERIMESYRFMNNQWENGTDAESRGGLKEAFFTGSYRKRKMFQNSRRQKAIANFVMLVLKGGDEKAKLSRKQAKEIIVAYGDACPRHHIKGVAPAPNMPFYRKFKELATCVLVDEHRSSMNCSGCIQEMKDGRVFRLKCCRNNSCVRTTWNRDTNAGINMFNLLLWKTLYEDRPTTFSRTKKK